jgi:uncharacterized protein (TIGR02145 family)
MKRLLMQCFFMAGMSLFFSAQAQNVKDIDGNEYQTVKIGAQTWIKENLKVTHYNNGDKIATTTDTLNLFNELNPKYQWAYGGQENSAVVYGRLYTWYAVADDRKVCPAGWHVPTVEEWSVLVKNSGGSSKATYQLREAGNTHWIQSDSLVNNLSGFTALPSGERSYNGVYKGLGEYCRWWSANASETVTCNILYLPFELGYPVPMFKQDSYGLAVRCLKD